MARKNDVPWDIVGVTLGLSAYIFGNIVLANWVDNRDSHQATPIFYAEPGNMSNDVPLLTRIDKMPFMIGIKKYFSNSIDNKPSTGLVERVED